VSVPIYSIPTEQADHIISNLPNEVQKWVKSISYKPTLGNISLISDSSGNFSGVLFGLGDEKTRRRGRFAHGLLPTKLPEGEYHFADTAPPLDALEASLAWELGKYKFKKYKSATTNGCVLNMPADVDKARIIAMVDSATLSRDLVNTPANDMGPNELEAVMHGLSKAHKAELHVIRGDDLLKQNYPLIHTVGRAGPEAPRLLDMRWGNESSPKITLVGKGVTFDTGGLDLKPSQYMRLMKKDMGGSASIIGLAKMIMSQKLNIRLRVLIPAVENSVASNAFRPGDILTSRKGLTVEIGNTDAEGRLVLADALTEGDSEKPEIMIDMATLTGAARVALGPDLPPLYTDDDQLAEDILSGAAKGYDPLWRMPLWEPYDGDVSATIADLDNAPAGGFAGSITAALFLRRFVEHTKSWAHFDIYAWNPKALPARPQGGEQQAARAVFEMLEARYGH